MAEPSGRVSKPTPQASIPQPRSLRSRPVRSTRASLEADAAGVDPPTPSAVGVGSRDPTLGRPWLPGVLFGPQCRWVRVDRGRPSVGSRLPTLVRAVAWPGPGACRWGGPGTGLSRRDASGVFVGLGITARSRPTVPPPLSMAEVASDGGAVRASLEADAAGVDPWPNHRSEIVSGPCQNGSHE